MCVAVPTDDGRNSYVFNGARTTKSTRTICFLPRTLRQSLSCVLIPFPCVLPGSRVEFCQWCALVRWSPFCLTFLFVPFAPRHHRTSHHGISTHLLHFGVTGFLLSPNLVAMRRRCCSRHVVALTTILLTSASTSVNWRWESERVR